MKTKLSIHFWLGGLAIIMLLLTTLFRVEVSSAHGYKPTNTPTATPTLTPIPMLQACQVSEIFINEQPYSDTEIFTAKAGEPIHITLRVVDAAGQILIGANVDATVTRQDLAASQAASAIPPLIDQSGTYDGVYTQTELPGKYLFNFQVSDFYGPRFLPCAAEGIIVIVEPKICEVDAVPDYQEIFLNQPVVLTANVTINGVLQANAVVTATVDRPEEPQDGPIEFEGDGPYIRHYSRTDLVGQYTFHVSASSPDGSYQPCTDPTPPIVKVTAPKPQCTITAPPNFDKDRYFVGDTINFETTISNTQGTEVQVTAVVTQPNEFPIDPPPVLTSSDKTMYQGSFTAAMSGTYTVKVMGNDPTGQNNFISCSSPEGKAIVVDNDDPIITTTIKIDPLAQEIDLCGQFGNTSNQVVIENVTDLASVQFELSYDPKAIQVVDAGNQRGVQVKFNPGLTPTENRVDTNKGQIFFKATAVSPINDTSNLITIDWLPQQGPGQSNINFEDVILTNSAGQTIKHTAQNGQLKYSVGSKCFCGQALLQGQADHSGIMVTSSTGEQRQTYPSGFFAIPAKDTLTLSFPAYLSTQVEPQACLGSSQTTLETASLNMVHLLAGDINSDGLINIMDIAYIASHYQSTDSTADLNTDGVVDILDLALAAGNYQP